jgi:hypothetical protein
MPFDAEDSSGRENPNIEPHITTEMPTPNTNDVAPE